MTRCATPNCERDAHPTTPDGTVFRFCDDCTATVLRTGRPPVIPVKFVPAWLRHAKAKELTRSAA